MKKYSRSGSRAMHAAVLGIAVLYIGSTVLTPMYPIYERVFSISELTITEVYAAYVIGNLAVLFVFGRISDQLGRRPTALVAMGVVGLSAGCFLIASDAWWLAAGRVLGGFAAGLGAATLTAWIAELEPRGDHVRAAAVTTAGNMAGLAFGAVAAGILAAVGPLPLRTSWILYLAIVAGTTILLRSLPETVERRIPASRLSLHPRIGVPDGLRTVFLGAAALAFASFALGGFYTALTPGLLTHRMGQTNVAVIGGVTALFYVAAAITATGARKLSRGATLGCAVTLVIIGLGLLLLADGHRSLGLLLAATVVCGAAMALGYRGSLTIVDEIAPHDRRAELLASYLLVVYIGNSLPVVTVGFLSRAAGPETAHQIFAAVLALLAIIAAAIAARRSLSTVARAH
jgi:MFS family permease